MSKVAKIKNMDIANGEGIRFSVFFSGCDFNCKNCFNKDIQDFNVGEKFNYELYENEIKPLINEHIAGLSILGGEALHQNNIKATNNLITWFKRDFPNKNIWLWTGFTWEEIIERCKNEDRLNWLIYSIDILVDGRFIEEQKDLTLKWRGSKNQRVIDIEQTLEQNKIILYEK